MSKKLLSFLLLIILIFGLFFFFYSPIIFQEGSEGDKQTQDNTWEAVLTALNNCEAESVFQTHSKLVTLELKNGSKITAYEPQIDEVMKVVDGLNGKCGDIRMATE